jgi:uncharacterized protein (TIGR03032 family)
MDGAMTVEDDAQASPSEEAFALTTSRHFSEWLASVQHSLAFTTYRAGKAFFIGVKPDGKLSVFERSFSRCMGMGVSGNTRSLLISSEYQIHRLDNILPEGARNADGMDATFAPHQSWVTGDLDVHDIGFGKDGKPVFINTLFNCIATVSDGYSFKPLWKPPFISRYAAEDRCHLNGMALEQGEPRYVTAVSRSDTADGWRDRRADGGIVLDVASGEVIVGGLSMPHSPRLHAGKLWLLNSGTGEFGFVDRDAGAFIPVAFVPGFARGLAFVAGHAVIGLSLPRENRTFSGLDLDAQLHKRDTEPRCGLAVINLETGDMTGWVRVEGVVRELYDVTALPGLQYPSAIGFKTNEVKHVLSIDY